MSAYGAAQVATTATVIVPAVQAGYDDSALVTNLGPNTIYVGTDASVVATTGTPVLSGQSITLKHGSQGLWGICAVLQATPLDTRYLVEVAGS